MPWRKQARNEYSLFPTAQEVVSTTRNHQKAEWKHKAEPFKENRLIATGCCENHITG